MKTNNSIFKAKTDTQLKQVLKIEGNHTQKLGHSPPPQKMA